MAAPDWLHELPQTPSTNSWAKAHLNDLPHGSVVHTRRQTDGRGQRGRHWLSPPGVLTCSVVVDLPAPSAARQLGLASGLAVALAVEDCCPDLRIALKWPNDVYCDDRKLAGILCEGQQLNGGFRAVVGIGLNHAVDFQAAGFGPTDWPDLPRPPIALADRTATVPDEGSLLAALRRFVLEATGMLSAGHWHRLLPELRRRDWLDGRSVVVTDRDPPLAGTAAGLTDDGELLLASAHGGAITIDQGHVREAVPHPAEQGA